ncbi:MAG: hypothetical protein H7837_12255 [Magnetococcus sp. MYC-9]
MLSRSRGCFSAEPFSMPVGGISPPPAPEGGSPSRLTAVPIVLIGTVFFGKVCQ